MAEYSLDMSPSYAELNELDTVHGGDLDDSTQEEIEAFDEDLDEGGDGEVPLSFEYSDMQAEFGEDEGMLDEMPDAEVPQAFDEDLDEQDDVTDIGFDLSDINPNYDPWDVDSPYNSNCGSCALAVQRRLDGDDVSAVATDSTLTVEEMQDLTGMEQVPMQPDKIAEYLKSQGPGAHAIIGIDRSEGPGHWFNAYYDGKNVYALDGQTGETYPWAPDYGDVTNWDVSVKKGGM